MTAHAPGDLLDGRYQLSERIGSGGMGTVYRAHDTRLDRTVAIKLLHDAREVDDVTRARLQAEARLAGVLQHPGIVQVFDYGEEPGAPTPTPYVVMQYVEGTPLSALLRERGALPAQSVADLLADLGQALSVAHAAGIVHRDLKPSNILVTAQGRAVLVDFGVARSDTAEPLTETGHIIGSADYLSPEQVRGRRATPASDIYALGIVAHQCLTAVSPFRRETQAATLLARLDDAIPELGPQVPAPMRALVGRMMSPEPDERPTATEVARWATMLDQPTVTIPPPPAPATRPPAVAPTRHVRRLVALVAAALLVLATGGVVLLVRGHDGTPSAGAADLLTPTGRSTTAVPTSVRLDADHLVGMTYAAAARSLRHLGLRPVRVDRPGTAAVGTVRAVSPDGRVRIGSRVTLVVATAQAVVAATPTPTPTRSAAAHPTTHAPATPKPKPGKSKPAKHKPDKPGKPKTGKHGKKKD